MVQTALKQLKEATPFLELLEDLLAAPLPGEDETGLMDGSLSGEKWRLFLAALRAEVVDRLKHYNQNSFEPDFCPATMGMYRDDRKRIERLYIRQLVALYRNARKSYATLSGSG